MQLQPGTTIEQMRKRLDEAGLPEHLKPYHVMMNGKILGLDPYLPSIIHATGTLSLTQTLTLTPMFTDGCTVHIKPVAEQRHRLGVRSRRPLTTPVLPPPKAWFPPHWINERIKL